MLSSILFLSGFFFFLHPTSGKSTRNMYRQNMATFVISSQKQQQEKHEQQQNHRFAQQKELVLKPQQRNRNVIRLELSYFNENDEEEEDEWKNFNPFEAATTTTATATSSLSSSNRAKGIFGGSSTTSSMSGRKLQMNQMTSKLLSLVPNVSAMESILEQNEIMIMEPFFNNNNNNEEEDSIFDSNMNEQERFKVYEETMKGRIENALNKDVQFVLTVMRDFVLRRRSSSAN